jgi:hypothetical protein
MNNIKPIFEDITMEMLTDYNCHLFKDNYKEFKGIIDISEMFTFQQISFIALLNDFHYFPEDLQNEINKYLDKKEEEVERKYSDSNKREA